MQEDSIAKNELPVGIKTNVKTNSMRRNPNKVIQAPKQQIKREKNEFRGKIIHHESTVVKWDILISNVRRDRMQNALNVTSWVMRH